jgi:hypothetical protein
MSSILPIGYRHSTPVSEIVDFLSVELSGPCAGLVPESPRRKVDLSVLWLRGRDGLFPTSFREVITEAIKVPGVVFVSVALRLVSFNLEELHLDGQPHTYRADLGQ